MTYGRKSWEARVISSIRAAVPVGVRRFVQRVLPLTAIKLTWNEGRNPLSQVRRSAGAGEVPPGVLAIQRNRNQAHIPFVKACLDLGAAFQVLELDGDEWEKHVRTANVRVLLAWPDASDTSYAKMVKDRCDLIEEEMGILVFPNRLERWLYEDKVRQRDWLILRGLPAPRTHVLFDRTRAMAFARSCDLPLVFKTSFGAAATGVEIVRSRRRLRSMIRKAFGRGHVPAGHDIRDKQRGSILLQEFLEDPIEWRMVRIGDSYFGHPKGRVGAFHSGSGAVEWTMPEERHLDLLHQVTEEAGFRSMAMDVFETTDGRLLINELQTVFGASTSVDQLRKGGVPGRMVRHPGGSWEFEAGDFARNACANERVRYVLKLLEGQDA